MGKLRTMLLGLTACTALAIMRCGKDNAPTAAGGGGGGTAAGGDRKLTMYLLPKSKGNPYFETCNNGAQAAAKELGMTVIFDGPTGDQGADQAAKMIDQWKLKGADVIAVSASDPEILKGPMKEAMAKKIHVITWDADTSADSRELFVCQASAEEIGNALTDTLAADIGGGKADAASGEVAIVSAQATAANQNEWIKFIKARLEKYPNLKLVDIQYSDDNQTKAQQQTQALMTAHPQLKGVFAISSQAFPAAAEAIKLAGNGGKVQVTGLSTPSGMREYVKTGVVKSVVLWNTEDLGYLTVYTAHAVATGEYKPGATILKAGKLGEKAIIDGKVMLGKILVFNKDNIDDYKF